MEIMRYLLCLMSALLWLGHTSVHGNTSGVGKFDDIASHEWRNHTIRHKTSSSLHDRSLRKIVSRKLRSLQKNGSITKSHPNTSPENLTESPVGIERNMFGTTHNPWKAQARHKRGFVNPNHRWDFKVFGYTHDPLPFGHSTVKPWLQGRRTTNWPLRRSPGHFDGRQGRSRPLFYLREPWLGLLPLLITLLVAACAITLCFRHMFNRENCLHPDTEFLKSFCLMHFCCCCPRRAANVLFKSILCKGNCHKVCSAVCDEAGRGYCDEDHGSECSEFSEDNFERKESYCSTV